jgi:hypothetical protein
MDSDIKKKAVPWAVEKGALFNRLDPASFLVLLQR